MLLYRFSYTINGMETFLVSRAQSSNSLSSSLPSGPPPSEGVDLAVYAMDTLGAESKSTVVADRVTPLTVVCRRQALGGVAMADFLSGVGSSRLQDNLAQVGTPSLDRRVSLVASCLTVRVNYLQSPAPF